MSSHTQQITGEPDPDTREAEKRNERVLSKFVEPRKNTQQFLDDLRRHTDARSIREYFGIPSYDREAFNYPNVLPNCLEHSWDAGRHQSAGGTDALVTGKPGTGKSTLALHLANRVMDVNNEKVVWRGSSSRSEWLPFAPWTRLCLPSAADVTAELVPRDPTDPTISLDMDELEEKGVIREIVRYDDPIDINKNLLKPGQFHVVYPDPSMSGCQSVYEQSDEKTYEGLEFSPDDPVGHWWFAWMLARVEHGPHDWTTLVLDEIGDLAPEAARSDDFSTYEKIEMLRDCWVDARKMGLTIFAFGHSERDIHNLIRHKIRWRVTMNQGSNPTRKTDIVGFDNVPMDYDMTSKMSIGEALMFTEQNYEKFAWSDYPAPVSHKLKLDLEV